MKRIFGVTGGNGKIGSILLKNRPSFVKLDCDITDPLSIEKALRYSHVDIIVNCASISSIDECEKNFQKAIDVNVKGLANLHRIFGKNILSLSSEYVFSGRDWFLPKEDTGQNPINNYGLTKLSAEAVSRGVVSDEFDGKTIRLSRSVRVADSEIIEMMDLLSHQLPFPVPTFFRRSYLHKEFVADGIEYMVNNWDVMPKMVNYAGTDRVSMYTFLRLLAIELGFDPKLITKNRIYDSSQSPRPKWGGLNVNLAKSLGFPMYGIGDTVSKLRGELIKND